MQNAEILRQLKHYLAKHDKRQYELASELGVAPPTVNHWLTGKTKVSKAYQNILKSKKIVT